MSLSRYMALCLYHPQYGYYMSKNPLGRSGDFITAPEVSSLFGEIIALSLIANTFERGYKTADLVEFGGGHGTQMADVLHILNHVGYEGQAHMVELSPALQKIQQATLKDFDVSWHTDFESIAGESPLIMVANEFFDAFPVEQYIFADNQWQEMCIDLSEGMLTWNRRPADFVPPSGYPASKEGDFCEHPTAAIDYFRRILRHIKRHGGMFLTLDYGYTTLEYGNTLQAIKEHRFVDPLDHPGKCDLTTHVNFALLESVVEEEGLTPLPLMTQEQFLKHYGILERYEQVLDLVPASERKNLEAALERLTHPDAMGTLFKALVVVE